MVRPYFEEVQHFRNNGWLWTLIIFVSVAVMLPMFYGMYWQLIKGIPWGDKPLSDTGLIALSLFVMGSWGIAAALMLSMRLEVRIDTEGIHYRFIPIKRNWRHITKPQIMTYGVKKGFPLFTSGGFGHHRSIFLKTRSFRISGNQYLQVEVMDGEKILLGTQNAGEMERAMKKLMQVNESI